MKFAITALLILALVPFLASAQSTDLDIILVEQNPSPAEPGTNVAIEVSLQNNGLQETSILAVEIMPNGPFSLVKGDKVRTFTRIGPGNTFQLTYTLLVDDLALAGDYDLEFRLYGPNTPDSYATKEVEINVIGDTRIILESVDTVPATLEPGGSATINVHIKNVGTGDARQVEVSMTSDAEELVPILSGGLVYLGDLDAGASAVAPLRFNIDPDADQETFLATLSIDYKDENNNEATETFTIGIPVEGNIRFEIVTIEPSYSRGTLNIEVANKGTGDAQSVEGKLIINGETIGIDYLSQLKATKKTTFNFPIALSGQAELHISYVEPGLAQKTVIKDLGPLNFAAPGGNGSSSLVFVIILVVVGYFVWKRFFRKKKRN